MGETNGGLLGAECVSHSSRVWQLGQLRWLPYRSADWCAWDWARAFTSWSLCLSTYEMGRVVASGEDYWEGQQWQTGRAPPRPCGSQNSKPPLWWAVAWAWGWVFCVSKCGLPASHTGLVDLQISEVGLEVGSPCQSRWAQGGWVPRCGQWLEPRHPRGFCGCRRSGSGTGRAAPVSLPCSRLSGILGPFFLLLGLALPICEMGMIHHQMSRLSLSHSFRQHWVGPSSFCRVRHWSRERITTLCPNPHLEGQEWEMPGAPMWMVTWWGWERSKRSWVWYLGTPGRSVLNWWQASVQFSSVSQSCPTLCDPMNRSTPGLPVHHKLPEFTQTHAHWVGDAIQPSHPLLSPSPPAPNPSQHQGFFQWVNSSHEVAKVLEFQLQHQSIQWTPRTDLL